MSIVSFEQYKHRKHLYTREITKLQTQKREEQIRTFKSIGDTYYGISLQELELFFQYKNFYREWGANEYLIYNDYWRDPQKYFYIQVHTYKKCIFGCTVECMVPKPNQNIKEQLMPKRFIEDKDWGINSKFIFYFHYGLFKGLNQIKSLYKPSIYIRFM